MRLGIALLAATPLFAQFSQLVATDDGKQIYFISNLTLFSAPTSQNFESRLYRIGPDGVSLVAQRPPLRFGDFSISGGSSDGVSNPQLSGDASLIGFTYQNVCTSTPCATTSNEAELIGSTTAELGPGTLQLSRNGRWALITLPPQPTGTLIDLTTGRSSTPPSPPFAATRAIASNGAVLVQNGIWRNGALSIVPPLDGIGYSPLALSDNASTIVSFAFAAGSSRGGSSRLIAIDVASGNSTVLSQVTSTTLPIFSALSNDGRRALYRVTPLASAAGMPYIADTTTGQSTPVPVPPGELALDGTLSGDGAIAFIVTTSGRIVKVTLATGSIEPLLPPTPYIANAVNLPIGSVVHLQTTYAATTADWTGHILLGGRPLPVLAVKPGGIDVQIPWEQPAGPVQFHVAIPTGSPFEQFQTSYSLPIAPAFEPLDPGQSAIFPIKIVKGDWSGFVTSQPQAGDIVYVYMTGLGPVAIPVQTGVPASLTTPNPITGKLTCTFLPQTRPAETLFAGLAPGGIGVYQAAFRIPADPNKSPFIGMGCDVNGSAGIGFTSGSSGTIVLP